MHVKAVLRFWHGGRLIEPDEVVDVDESLAREVIASGKAVVAVAPEPETNSQTSTQDPTDPGLISARTHRSTLQWRNSHKF